MTNQEASKVIKDGLDDMSIDYTDEEQQEALTMAIKALEQEPCEKDWRFYYDHGYAQAKRDLSCEDAISRQAVIDAIEKLKKIHFDRVVVLNKVRDRVLELPSVKQEPKWIPVSERLPKKSGNYWCTFGGTNLTGKDYYTTESDAKEIFDEPEEYVGWQTQNVIAWMPLPEPYKAGSEDEE